MDSSDAPAGGEDRRAVCSPPCAHRPAARVRGTPSVPAPARAPPHHASPHHNNVLPDQIELPYIFEAFIFEATQIEIYFLLRQKSISPYRVESSEAKIRMANRMVIFCQIVCLITSPPKKKCMVLKMRVP